MIAIIILTHNNLSSTKKCLKALYKHTKNFQLIIIDNASTDGTIEYLKQLSKDYDNVTINYNASNMGIVRSRNYGYKIVKNLSPYPSFLGFLDNDQMVLPGWWKFYLQLFDQNYDVLGIEAWKMRDSDFYPYKKITNPDETFSYVGAGGLFINKKVIQNTPQIFSNDYHHFFEDPEFIFDIFYNTPFKVGWNYNPIIIHNHQGSLLTSKTRKYFYESWEKFQNKWKGTSVPSFKMK